MPQGHSLWELTGDPEEKNVVEEEIEENDNIRWGRRKALLQNYWRPWRVWECETAARDRWVYEGENECNGLQDLHGRATQSKLSPSGEYLRASSAYSIGCAKHHEKKRFSHCIFHVKVVGDSCDKYQSQLLSKCGWCFLGACRYSEYIQASLFIIYTTK